MRRMEKFEKGGISDFLLFNNWPQQRECAEQIMWYIWREISRRKKFRSEKIKLKVCLENLGISRLNINLCLEEMKWGGLDWRHLTRNLNQQ